MPCSAVAHFNAFISGQSLAMQSQIFTVDKTLFYPGTDQPARFRIKLLNLFNRLRVYSSVYKIHFTNLTFIVNMIKSFYKRRYA